MFTKILIANRGEIACRVMQTARRLGVKTVAVYSDADANAMHVKMADESVRIGAAAVSESYLLGNVIVDAALATGAQAIHPGYGFLSENPEFVEQVEAAGLCFIGPGADAIRAMGLKDAAKKLMQQAGVPVVPGYHGDNQEAAFLKQQADELRYPVLIKARAGGGGKGMRLVESAEQFESSLASAQREAQASFGDAACLVEKFVTAPRHIEIQVFGDNHGNVVHLFERDCSLQRRHQKVIEEAPAPGMTEAMREAMGQAAVNAAAAINYSGAGTVEFIVDSSDGLRPDRFWFMEMNTRLQVEHPVTEMITRVDLVEWQLRVAAGEKLPSVQSDLSIKGWAMEARIYAEDAEKGFLPSTGTLHYLRFPDNARVDTGVASGDTITPFYDPMIAKLTVHGASRDEARRKLFNALGDTHASGSITNINFLRDLVSQKDFASGDVDTGLIERNIDALTDPRALPDVAACLAAMHHAGLIGKCQPFTAFTLWKPLLHTVVLRDMQDQNVFVSLASNNGTDWDCVVADTAHTLSLTADYAFVFDGATVRAVCREHAAGISVFIDRAWHLTIPDPLDGTVGDNDGGDTVVAPMPGQIKLVQVGVGDEVKSGDTLIVMEAMKMEHTLTAPRDGTVEDVPCAIGDQVDDGAILLMLRQDISD